MNRRGFEDTLNTLKASLAEHAKRFFEDRGLSFDEGLYKEQSSIDLDDVAREMLFFGANVFPPIEESAAKAQLSAAA